MKTLSSAIVACALLSGCELEHVVDDLGPQYCTSSAPCDATPSFRIVIGDQTFAGSTLEEACASAAAATGRERIVPSGNVACHIEQPGTTNVALLFAIGFVGFVAGGVVCEHVWRKNAIWVGEDPAAGVFGTE